MSHLASAYARLLFFPVPPNFIMSLQNAQLPQSSSLQPVHWPQRLARFLDTVGVVDLLT